MTDTHVRETLRAVRDGVVVPPIDHGELQARAGRFGRRRRVVRAAGTAGAAAAAIAAVVGAAAVLPGLAPGDDPSTASSGAAASTDPGAPGVPVVLDGRIELLQDDGSLADTGLEGTPVGWLDGRQVVLDGDRLLGVEDEPITGVTSAFVDSSGVSYQRDDGRVRWSGDAGHDVPAEGTLLAAGARGYVVGSPSGAVIHDVDGAHPVDLGSDGNVVTAKSADVAGGTAVVVDAGSEHFFDLDGTRRYSLFGGGTGALSQDGRTWAYAPDAAERRDGMRPGLVLASTTDDDATRLALTGDAVDLTWYEGDLFVLTQQALAEGGTARTLWQCDADGCEERLTRPGDTLTLR